MFITKLLKIEEQTMAGRNEIVAGFESGSVDVFVFKKDSYSNQKQG